MNEPKVTVMPVHPACDLFPMMSPEALAGLASDIRANGLVHPIVVHEGQVVDGRNRLRACEQSGVEPRFVEWRELYQGAMPLGRWIWSVNVERRHLTSDQIAAATVAMRALEEKEAAQQRQEQTRHAERDEKGQFTKATPAGHDCAPPDAGPKNPAKAETGRVREILAQHAGVSVRKIRQAITVESADPELLKHVQHGEVSLREAEKLLKAGTRRGKAPAPARQKLTRAERTERVERLARLRLSFLESTKHLVHLIAWLGETSGDFDQAELLLSNAGNAIAAVTAEIERQAVAADPLNASRLGIKEGSLCQ